MVITMIEQENLNQQKKLNEKPMSVNQGTLPCYNELPPPLNEKAILTVQETADFLRVHRTTVSGYIKSGELKSYKLKGRRLLKALDVWMFFENQVAMECVSNKEDCLWLQ